MPTIFPFHLISPVRFLGCFPRLLSHFLFIAHTVPRSDFCRIYGHTLLCSPSYIRSAMVIYIFFVLGPLMHRRFIGLSIVNGVYNAPSINVIFLNLMLLKWFFHQINTLKLALLFFIILQINITNKCDLLQYANILIMLVS